MLDVLHLPLTHIQAQQLLSIIDSHHERINYEDLPKSLDEVHGNLVVMNNEFRQIKKFLQQAGK